MQKKTQSSALTVSHRIRKKRPFLPTSIEQTLAPMKNQTSGYFTTVSLLTAEEQKMAFSRKHLPTVRGHFFNH